MSDRIEHEARVVQVLDQEKPQLPPPISSLSFLLSVFWKSLTLVFGSKHIFLLIFLFLSLPLSFLLFCLSLSSRPLKNEILRLESLGSYSSTRMEAREVWKESRQDSVSLLQLKALYSLPIALLSLFTSISSVHTSSLLLSQKHLLFASIVTSIKLAWKRVLVTSFFSYILLLLYNQVPMLVAAVFRNQPHWKLLILLTSFCFEVLLIMILGLGLVVSVLEERFGWDAVQVGSRLMKGRRVCGWMVSGSLVALSWWIGIRFKTATEDEDMKAGWMILMAVEWEKAALVCLYGLLVLWSYVVTTVFYMECRKRHNV